MPIENIFVNMITVNDIRKGVKFVTKSGMFVNVDDIVPGSCLDRKSGIIVNTHFILSSIDFGAKAAYRDSIEEFVCILNELSSMVVHGSVPI